MNLLKTTALVVAGGLALFGCKPSSSVQEPKLYNEGIHIIPQPAELTLVGDSAQALLLDGQYTIIATGEELTAIGQYLSDKLAQSTGLQLQVVDTPRSDSPKHIELRLVGSDVVSAPEGYTLDATTSEGILIQGSTPRGIYWGVQTLLQLLPAEVESQSRVRGMAWQIPQVSIHDQPYLDYRGQHFDVSRHFLTVEEMKRHIDVMSMLKLNKLHWHLTDDQGWRIEIKQYPRLTEVGSVRTEGDGSTYGPYFYTQEEVKEIVAYAKARYVEVIPEIELPGHSAAALAAYPYLGCNGEDFPYEVRNIWDISRETYCAGKDTVFTFLQNVLEEVIPLFESEYIHIGGDEVPKASWERCPLCQERIRREGLKDEHELQSYFIHRIEKVLLAHNKRLIGWEEILEGGLAPTAIVMSWTGEKGGILSANMGHQVIMTPGSEGLYLDHYQGDQNVEPLAICCYAPLSKPYAYDPVSKEIDEDKRHLVLGVQGNVWGEYIYTPKQYEYLAYPRMLAVAETGWTRPERKEYSDFLRRLDNALVRLDMHDIHYYIPQPQQPQHQSINTVTYTGESYDLALETEYPVHAILYTTDGTEPTADRAHRYSGPIKVTEDTVVKVRSLLVSGKMSDVRAITIRRSSYAPATEAPEGIVSGLTFSIAKGHKFDHSDQLLAYTGTMETAVITDIAATRQPMYTEEMIEHIAGKFNHFGAIYTGYIMIPEDGVYRFSTIQNQLAIDGEVIIDNEGLIKKNVHTDTTIALSKGLHQIRLTYIPEIRQGWTTQWADLRPLWARFDQGESLTPIPDTAYFTTSAK